MKQWGCRLELGVEGQCDSTDHNATYVIVTLTDCEAKKVLHLKIIHVKVSFIF